MELLVKKPHITVWYDPEHQWLYSDWIGDQNYTTVQDGGIIILEQVVKNKIRKVLNDNTHVTSAWSDAANEGGQVWFPALRQAGVEYFAWIYSPHAFSRLSADIALGYAKESPEIAVFDSLSEAEEWLISQE